MAINLDQAVGRAMSWGNLFVNAPPRWTEADNEFVRKNLSFLTDEEIGEKLGRSAVAVQLRRKRDMRLPAPSKMPGYLTGQQVAKALGVDIHSIMALVKRGILPGRAMAGPKGILLVRRVTLLRWAANPLNWPYYRAWEPGIPDEHIRRLVARQILRWGDEWLTPQQAAELRGVTHHDVNRMIHAGKLQGLQWGNWWIRRSEITRPDVVFYKGRGGASVGYGKWNDRVDAFIIRGRAAGMTCADIAARTKWPEKRVQYRARLLKRAAVQKP